MKPLLLAIVLVMVVLVSATTPSFAEDDTYWTLLAPSKTTAAATILVFGPPAAIKTEQPYADWIRNQASGCGQLDTYALSYSSAAGDLNILKGPLGKASAVDVFVDAGKVIEVVWTYNNNQQESAFREWMSHKGFDRVGGKKPTVMMFGRWRPKAGSVLFAGCYTRGESPICRGPISVRYYEDTGK
jgi:hypothetical protein